MQLLFMCNNWSNKEPRASKLTPLLKSCFLSNNYYTKLNQAILWLAAIDRHRKDWWCIFHDMMTSQYRGIVMIQSKLVTDDNKCSRNLKLKIVWSLNEQTKNIKLIKIGQKPSMKSYEMIQFPKITSMQLKKQLCYLHLPCLLWPPLYSIHDISHNLPNSLPPKKPKHYNANWHWHPTATWHEGYCDIIMH